MKKTRLAALICTSLVLAAGLAVAATALFVVISQCAGAVLHIAIAWIMAVVADLVINKPLGLSPKGIEWLCWRRP